MYFQIYFTLIPNEEEFLRKCEQEGRPVKETWEGRGPTEHKCDLAQGPTKSHTNQP